MTAKANETERDIKTRTGAYLQRETLPVHMTAPSKATRSQLIECIAYERAARNKAMTAYERVSRKRDDAETELKRTKAAAQEVQAHNDKLIEDNTALTDTVADLKAIASDRAQTIDRQAHTIDGLRSEVKRTLDKATDYNAKLTERSRFADNLGKTNAELRNEVKALREGYGVRLKQHTDDMHRWQHEYDKLKTSAFVWSLGNMLSGAVLGGVIMVAAIRVFGWA